MKKAIFILLMVTTLIVGLILPALGAQTWPSTSSVTNVNFFRPVSGFTFNITTGGREYGNIGGTGQIATGSMIFPLGTYEFPVDIEQGVQLIKVNVNFEVLCPNLVEGAYYYFDTRPVVIYDGNPVFNPQAIEFINAEVVTAGGRKIWDKDTPFLYEGIDSSTQLHLYFNVFNANNMTAFGIWDTIVTQNAEITASTSSEIFVPYDPEIFAQYSIGYNDGLTTDAQEAYESGFSNGREQGYTRGFEEGYDQGFNEGTNPSFITWISTMLDGFLSFEIMPGFSFGSIFMGIVGLLCFIAFLKYFAGG